MSRDRDLARAVLVACVFAFGASRPDWGRAMLAELAESDDRRARRRFVAGCARALAVTLPSRGAARLVTVGGLAAGAASLAIVAVALLRYPGVVSGAGTWVAVGAFSVVVVLYVTAAARLGAPLLEWRLVWPTVAAGTVTAGTWLAIGLNTSIEGPGAVTLALLVVGSVVGVAGGCHARARSDSTRTGLHCVGITAIAAGLLVFIGWAGEAVLAAGRPYDAGLLRDFGTAGAPDLATYAVNEGLGTAMVLLLLVPLVSASTGTVGAAVAGMLTSSARSRALRPGTPPTPPR